MKLIPDCQYPFHTHPGVIAPPVHRHGSGSPVHMHCGSKLIDLPLWAVGGATGMVGGWLFGRSFLGLLLGAGAGAVASLVPWQRANLQRAV